ncbi:MAG: dihydropteroate synthase [Hyphomicrobiaceae bacterium]|nr:dihydropteroate synthase [Hyphomicrobiaceae bacterium]
MTRETYIRPIGLYPAQIGNQANGVWGCLRLASGWLDFSALEIIERKALQIERRITGLSDFMELDWGRCTLSASKTYDYLQTPRARIKGLSLDKPRVMGIVNVTPDSFFDGARYTDTEAAIIHGKKLVDEGADILDVGGESTRPGSDAVPENLELDRVIPVIEGLAGQVDALISIDTRKSSVMQQAINSGVDLINDVSALTYEPDSLKLVAKANVPVILMHAQGEPKTMQNHPTYRDVVLDVFDYLESRVDACISAGIPHSRIIIDPGIGFGKTLAHNLSLLSHLSLLHGLGLPILVGASRKSFITHLTSCQTAEKRLSGSLAAACHAVSQGVQIIRVHDVLETSQALKVWQSSSQGIMDNVIAL